MEAVLRTYLEKCRAIFNAQHSKLPKVVPLPRKKEPIKDELKLFETAIKEAEETEEFQVFAKYLGDGFLAYDLKRLVKKEERQREKSKSKHQVKSIDEWRQDTARHAAKGFFRNTGIYVKLWQGFDLQESYLLNILSDYKNKSEFIRLFVFDGFVPYHERKQLNNIALPVGEFKTYTKAELKSLLMLPQTLWHGAVNPEIIEKAGSWHILTVREQSEYRGMTGIWIDGVLVSPVDWSEIGEPIKKEGDIGIIGPMFLCIGENANLAAEIRVRTNIFEYFPVYYKLRNDYLPWDEDEIGPKPRAFIHYLGEEGNILREVYEIWRKVNDLDADGLLRYPTEAYVRSVMNLHASWEGLMETFVGFVTVIESLLTPGTRQELSYKLAVRGAALLAVEPEHRMRLFQILDEFYKTRSRIVHEGHTGKEDPFEFEHIISHNLTEISRQIFLRYICLLNMGHNDELPKWVLPAPGNLLSRTSRPKAIANILDGLVLDPGLTARLEKRMDERGLNEDWIRKMTVRLFEGPTKRVT